MIKLQNFATWVIFILTVQSWSTYGQNRNGSSFRTQSYYGFSGLTFIPTTQVIMNKEFSVSYSSKPGVGKDVTLIPYSFRVGYGFGDRAEITGTNTFIYASQRHYGGIELKNSAVPFIPSVKYRFMSMSESNYYVAMAGGLCSPYGAYYVVDKRVRTMVNDLTVHMGISTKLTTYHVFAGLTFSSIEPEREVDRPFPLELAFEGSWGGSLKRINEKEEQFAAVTIRKAWTKSVFITTFLRFDNQPVGADVAAKKTTKFVGIGLDYTISHLSSSTEK